MKGMLMALLCTMPLLAGYNGAESPAAEALPPVETAAYCCSMGCDGVNCTDPSHYHLCPADCGEPTHYHDCPIGCVDPAHCHGGICPAPEFCPSMGCTVEDCTDPAHYHDCPGICTDPAHYHDCPVDCVDPAHCHGGICPAPEFCPSMGCTVEGCTDPAHYHYCPGICADPAHYHDCPVGCQAHAHGNGYGMRWRGGHHGGRQGCHRW